MIQSLSYHNVERKGFNSIQWHEIEAQIDIKKEKQFLNNKQFLVKIQKMELVLKKLTTGSFQLNLRGVSAAPNSHQRPTDQENASHSEGIEKGLFQMTIQLDLFPPSTLKSQLKRTFDQLKPLLTDGGHKDTSLSFGYCNL